MFRAPCPHCLLRVLMAFGLVAVHRMWPDGPICPASLADLGERQMRELARKAA